MNLKTLTLGAAVLFTVSACKKENPAKPEPTSSNKEVNACTGAQAVLDGTIVNHSPAGYLYVEAVTTDKFGNIFTSGIYNGKVDVNPGSGVFNLTGKGAFVQKTSPDGKFINAVSVPMGQPVDHRIYLYTDIATDDEGNVYLTVKDFAYGAKKAQIIKASNNGTILYRLKLDNTTVMSADEYTSRLLPSRIHAVVDKQGNLVVASIYNRDLLSNVDLDPGSGVFQAPGKAGGYLLKLDPSGKTLGVKVIPGGQVIKDMKIDANNNIHILTHTEFWGGTSYDNQYKYDPLGNLIYKTETEENSQIVTDNLGGIYLYGKVWPKDYMLGRYSPKNSKLWEISVPGLALFKADKQGDLYTLSSTNNILRLSKYNDSSLDWKIPVIQLMGGGVLMTVDNQNNAIIVAHTYPNKVRVLKYKPCK